ncbi:RNA polymerase factor sigma-54 [Candidatus Sororendozoicomonas aggregata]|uniref:RNA polymerase factor sigma-54 n=1 Tax=Candidatus Sororendozoicomonas aggregata TaxID=3073239 RepID=UPI002ED3E2DF
MKPSLQLKMGQQLTMTPQLQQAIRLLQLSSVELQQEIQEALDSNPMLETGETRAETPEAQPQAGEQPPDFNEAAPQEPVKEEAQWSEAIPSELPLDSKWDDIYSSMPTPPVEDDMEAHARSGTVDSLQDHLEWQLNLSPMNKRDLLIGLTIIEAINPDGYLSCPLEDITQALAEELDELEHGEVKVLQHRIQQFDPLGCASQNLRECLKLQLAQLDVAEPLLSITHQLIDDHLEALGSHDYATIMRKLHIKEQRLSEALQVIQRLNPKPGEAIALAPSEYVIPDVVVKKYKGRWSAELNADALPKLRINAGYAGMVKRSNTSRDNTFMKNHLQEARWFLKNLQNRNETLLKVTRKIVEHQQDFFTEGEAAMKPLVLADIADAVGVHESTISRVTTQKYMHTPRGLFELKYFFSSHVSTKEGGECSSTAIRALIRKMVSEENVRKPLSDNKISSLLNDQGIKVARRTIAKYRESLQIPPSNERKRLV